MVTMPMSKNSNAIPIRVKNIVIVKAEVIRRTVSGWIAITYSTHLAA